jgi:hypothetical protein
MTAGQIMQAHNFDTDEQLQQYMAARDLVRIGAANYEFVRQDADGTCVFSSPSKRLVATVTGDAVAVKQAWEVMQ